MAQKLRRQDGKKVVAEKTFFRLENKSLNHNPNPNSNMHIVGLGLVLGPWLGFKNFQISLIAIWWMLKFDNRISWAGKIMNNE